MKRILLTILSTIVAWPVLAAEAEWRLEKDEDGTQIYSRTVDGWDIREMRGVSSFGGALASLVAVIDDVSVMPAFNEFIEKSEVLQRDNANRYRIYTLTDMPWPLRDRDVLAQREIICDPETGVVTIIDVATRDLIPTKDGLVRIERSRQQWTLTPSAEGDVDIELRLLSDPAGPIPAVLINALSVSTPFKTLRDLKALAQQPKYAQAAPNALGSCAD
jgi:hypothetical protein